MTLRRLTAAMSLPWMLVGCAVSVVDLEATGHVALRKSDSERVKIASAYAIQSDDGIRIGGTVKRKRPGVGGSSGHIDIEVVGPDGGVIARTDINYLPRIIRRKGSKSSSFSKTIDVELPVNSTVYLRHHVAVRQSCAVDWRNGMRF